MNSVMGFTNSRLAYRAHQDLSMIVWSGVQSFGKPCESPIETLMLEAREEWP